MWRILTKIKRTPGGSTTDRAASALSRLILKLQHQWASWLSKKERRMSVRQKKWALLIFCISLGIISGQALYKGLLGTHETARSWFRINSLHPPITLPFPDTLELKYLYEREQHGLLQKTTIDSIHP